jgi:hypothetical protein
MAVGATVTHPWKPRSNIEAAVERYFQVSLFLLITTGFATLASTGRLDALSVGFVGIALILRAYLLLKQREFKIPERWTTYFTLIYVLVFVVDLFMISGSYVNASIHLVLFSLVVKIFSVQRERDYVYLAVLAFLAVLGASVLTVDSMFLGAFCVFVVLAVNTFVSMEIRRSLRKAVYSGVAASERIAGRKLGVLLSSAGALIVMAMVAVSTVLFFLLPRFSAGYLSGYAPHSDMVTGFSDHVNLGAIGRIQQTDNVVMHVQMDGHPPADLKWRGVTLNEFDGQNWKHATHSGSEEPEAFPSASGRYDLRKQQVERGNLSVLPQAPREFRLLHYRVIMEPIGTDVIFLAPIAVQLGGRFREIGIDDSGAIFNIDRARMSESYEAVSLLMEPSAERLRLKSKSLRPPETSSVYLQKPDEFDPRVQQLAEQIASGAQSDYDKALAIEKYLSEHYSYTLQLPSQTPKDPIAHFLFERKQGHCEYFASSMALMLRSINIPARLVNGFRNGEYNDLTGNYIVRAKNAHTWVEAYIPNAGWMSFDPTPADAAPTVTTFSRMRLYLDAAQEFWREWVINYDFGHQRELTLSTVSLAQRGAFDLRRWVRKQYLSALKMTRRVNSEVASHPTEWVAVAVFLAGLILVAWNARRIVRMLNQRAIAKTPSRAPQVAATIWYSRMLRSVAKQGYFKPATQTPEEFAKLIEEPVLRNSVKTFTEHYERARFGQSAEDAEQLPELFEEIAGKR